MLRDGKRRWGWGWGGWGLSRLHINTSVQISGQGGGPGTFRCLQPQRKKRLGSSHPLLPAAILHVSLFLLLRPAPRCLLPGWLRSSRCRLLYFLFPLGFSPPERDGERGDGDGGEEEQMGEEEDEQDNEEDDEEEEEEENAQPQSGGLRASGEPADSRLEYERQRIMAG